MRRVSLAALILAGTAGIHASSQGLAQSVTTQPVPPVSVPPVSPPEFVPTEPVPTQSAPAQSGQAQSGQAQSGQAQSGQAQSGRASAIPDSVFSATVSQSFEVDSNLELDEDSAGTSYFADTGLTLGYLRETASQSFELGFDSGLRALWEADEDFEFTAADPSAGRISFSQEGPNTAFDASAGLRTRTRNFDDPLALIDPDEPLPLPDDLERIRSETRELRYDADVGFSLGVNSPSTYAVRAGVSGIDYTDEAADEDLAPRQTLTGEASWTLAVTPVLSTALTGNYLLYDAEDDQETELTETSVDAGFIYQPAETLRLGFGLGYAEREREETVGGAREVTESDSGPLVRADLRYVLEAVTLTSNLRYTTAAPDPRFSGALRAVYALPRGRVAGRVFQRFLGNQAGDEQRITGAGIGLTREINNVSSVGLDFAFAVQENLDDADDPDTERADVTASYSYALTEAVAAEIGYRYRTRTEGPEDADSHRVFVTIARTFETGL